MTDTISPTTGPVPSAVNAVLQDLPARKAALRRVILKRRSAANTAEHGHAGATLARLASAHSWPTPPGVMTGFWPVRGEIDPRPMMEVLRAAGWQIALPVVVANEAPLVFRAWSPDDAMGEGSFRIPEPLPSAPELTPDAMLVPLVAFDAEGYRLGYGGGFYDRSIEKFSADGRSLHVIGVAYDAQEAVRIPRDHHDRRLDAILTPSGWRVPVSTTGEAS